jgi:eukaryotic-like serine/threonine-protein kinase
MTFAAGSRLGPYEIRFALGAGGMGEVYCARDTTLNRDVAIKVLLPMVASDPDRLARLGREAQILAALNHPNIAAIYGLEGGEGARALVMELVEGPTLAERIAKGAIPIDEALPIARQIAEALDAAHERGIIHRDLKPANIKITSDGVVKVLDFGLAKAGDSDTRGPDLTQSPTLTVAHTREGLLLGTPAYMSPEQTRGKTVDKRADIWAFGCVLYEMLTARRPFTGETASDMVAVILTREPEWRALPETTPVGVRRLLQRCLEKDPKRRLRDIGDARIDLDTLATDSNETSPSHPGVRRLRIAVGLVAALLMVSLAALALLPRRPASPVDESVRRFSMMLDEVRPVISPNGRHIAYRSNGRLWIRDLASETPREIPGGAAAGGYYSDTGYYLIWSPDSQDLVFPAEQELRRVSVAQGGSMTTICKLPEGRPGGRAVAGIAWSHDGESIVFSRYGAGIYEVPARAGSPKLLWKEDHADDLLLFDTPRGRAVMFAVTQPAGHDLVLRTPRWRTPGDCSDRIQLARARVLAFGAHPVSTESGDEPLDLGAAVFPNDTHHQR